MKLNWWPKLVKFDPKWVELDVWHSFWEHYDAGNDFSTGAFVKHPSTREPKSAMVVVRVSTDDILEDHGESVIVRSNARLHYVRPAE